MTAWWTGLAPAETTIECNGVPHVLRWDHGVLTAPDHGDPEGEATLAVLAGTTYPCLEHLTAWRRRCEDPRVLTAGSRGRADPVSIDPDDPRRRHTSRSRPEQQLLSLLALGGGLPDRLQATVAAAWSRRLRTGHRALESTRPQLLAALYGRALSALRTWLAEPELAIELEMIAPDAPRSLRRLEDGAVAVALPFAWLTEVWARDLTVVLGRFCLAATTDDAVHWALELIAPDLVTRETLEFTLRPAG